MKCVCGFFIIFQYTEVTVRQTAEQFVYINYFNFFTTTFVNQKSQKIV